jgi:hypothetical protein
VTQLTRVADAWKATIVDTLRYPLDDKVLYHECGEFFNLESIKALYNCGGTEINDDLLKELMAEPCLRCGKLFEHLYVCYPRCSVEEESAFSTLKEACGYFVVDE